MNGFKRRDLLAMAGAGVGLSTAGCLGSDDDGNGDGSNGDGGDSAGANDDESGLDGDGGGDGDANSSDGGEQADDEGQESTRTDLPSLQFVRVENDHDQSHAAHVLVENAGDIVHWSSHDVGSGEAVTLDRNWTSERGAFVVSIRIDDQTSWTQIDLTEERPNCYGVIPRITEDGSIERLWVRNPEGCGETATN